MAGRRPRIRLRFRITARQAARGLASPPLLVWGQGWSATHRRSFPVIPVSPFRAFVLKIPVFPLLCHPPSAVLPSLFVTFATFVNFVLKLGFPFSESGDTGNRQAGGPPPRDWMSSRPRLLPPFRFFDRSIIFRVPPAFFANGAHTAHVELPARSFL